MNPPDVPYCGPAPLPADLAGSWNLDPVLLGALALLALGYRAGAARHPAIVPPRARAAFAAGWATLVVAFVSPLCNLGVALFAARVGQHLLLAVVAAPLLALGRADLVLRALLARGSGRRGALARASRTRGAAALTPPTVAFAIVLWLWHAPAPYDATLRHDGVYWLMHLSLLAAATWLWAAVLRQSDGRVPAAAFAGLATSLQMGLLGALLVFAGRPLYASHLATSQAWGLSPVADQALGGLLCWVPGCAVFAAAGLAALAPLLRSSVQAMAPAALPASEEAPARTSLP